MSKPSAYHLPFQRQESLVINGEVVTMLLVDNDKRDRMTVRRSFKALNIANPLIPASDGIRALEYLRDETIHQNARPPVLVLLDLQMPRMGGFEFLAELNGDPTLRSTVVFVMTNSAIQEEHVRARSNTVAGYLRKDRPGQTFLTAIDLLKQYWRTIKSPNHLEFRSEGPEECTAPQTC